MRIQTVSIAIVVLANVCAADVEIVSRTSTARNYEGNGFGLPGGFDESGSFTGPGVGTITLPHGWTHTDTAYPNMISGPYRGSYSNDGATGIHPYSGNIETLTTTIRVTDYAVTTHITLNGEARPGGVAQSQDPTYFNAYLVITNADTNTIVFNSFDVAHNVDDPSHGLFYSEWKNVAWDGELSPGTYLIRIGASGVISDRSGPGQPLIGNGRLDATMAIVDPSGVVDFAYPRDRPTLLPPNRSMPVYVNVSSPIGSPVDGTGVLYSRVGVGGSGAFSATPMTQLAPDQYVATLPAAQCGQSVDYYFQVEAGNHDIKIAPASAPAAYFTASAGASQSNLNYDSEAATGFVALANGATSGPWQNRVPFATGAAGLGTPAADYDGSGKAWVTDNRTSFDVDGGPVQLLTPIQDLSGYGSVILSYARWLTCDTGEDRMVVEVTADNGATWTPLETAMPVTGWQVARFDLGSVIPLTSSVQVRFSVSDIGNNSRTEAGIDAITFARYGCGAACAADFNSDGFADFTDFDDFVALLEAGSTTADANNDGFLDFTDFDAFVTAFEAGC